MKTRLLKKLRKEAKAEYYIVDTGYKGIRYQVKQNGMYRYEGIEHFTMLKDAVEKLKSLRREYILKRLNSYRRKVLDI